MAFDGLKLVDTIFNPVGGDPVNQVQGNPLGGAMQPLIQYLLVCEFTVIDALTGEVIPGAVATIQWLDIDSVYIVGSTKVSNNSGAVSSVFVVGSGDYDKAKLCVILLSANLYDNLQVTVGYTESTSNLGGFAVPQVTHIKTADVTKLSMQRAQ